MRVRPVAPDLVSGAFLCRRPGWAACFGHVPLVVPATRKPFAYTCTRSGPVYAWVVVMALPEGSERLFGVRVGRGGAHPGLWDGECPRPNIHSPTSRADRGRFVARGALEARCAGPSQSRGCADRSQARPRVPGSVQPGSATRCGASGWPRAGRGLSDPPASRPRRGTGGRTAFDDLPRPRRGSLRRGGPYRVSRSGRRSLAMASSVSLQSTCAMR